MLVWSVIWLSPGISSDVTLVFEDAQVIPPFSRNETENTYDTDDIDDTDDTDDTDNTDNTNDTDDTDDTYNTFETLFGYFWDRFGIVLR